jgi:signal peptidase I
MQEHPGLTPPRHVANALTMAKAKRKRGETEETVRFLATVMLGILILRSFIAAPFVIPSESMLPRLFVGDYLIVAKWPYGYSRWSLPWGLPLFPTVRWSMPARGDVVVFRSPDAPPGDTNPAHDDHDVIKRVVGLPGDTIQVRRGQVILNGQAIPKQRIADFVLPITPNFTRCPPGHTEVLEGKPVCRYERYRETLPGGRSYVVLDTVPNADGDNTGLYSVPANSVFLMGDNRDNSADSRFPFPTGMGYIPAERVEGRALVTAFSTDGTASYWKPWTWFSAARPERIGEGF